MRTRLFVSSAVLAPQAVAWTSTPLLPTSRRTSPLAVAAEKSNRVDQASQTIEELTDAFGEGTLDVDEFLAGIESEVGKIDVMEAPKSTQDQVLGVAKEGAAALIKGVTAVAQETSNLAETLPNEKVGETSVTYGEAAAKVGKGAQGMWALASALGGFVKDTVENELLEQPEVDVEEEEEEEIEEEEEEEVEEEEVAEVVDEIEAGSFLGGLDNMVKRMMQPTENNPDEDSMIISEKEYAAKVEEIRALGDIPDEPEEEMRYDDEEERSISLEPKGIHPTLLSSFLQRRRRRRKEEQGTLARQDEVLVDDELEFGEDCPVPEEGEEPNLLPFFMKMYNLDENNG